MSRRAAFTLLLALAPALAGCGGGAPEPVSAEAAPTVLAEAFKGAGSELARLADDVVAAMQAGKWPAAHVALQGLTARPELTARQREAVAGCLVGVGEKLRAAAEGGDARAKEFQRLHQSAK